MQSSKLKIALAIMVGLNLAMLSLVGYQWLRAERPGAAMALEGAASLGARPALAQSGGTSRAVGLPDLSAAARRISPAVVGIGAVRTVVQRAWIQDYFSLFVVPMDLRERQRIPYLGSGVVVSSDGLVVTNHHVIADAEDLFVTMQDGREVKARLLDADRILDVAVLQLESEENVAADLGDSEDLLEGEWVLAVGNPFGNLISDPHATVTVGVVSALKRSFSPQQGRRRVYRDMIQTDAAINPGNSGGALVDAMGRVVGINTFIFSQGGGSNGIGFAIPINRVMKVVEEIRAHGRIRSLYPDFEVANITRTMAQHMNLRSTRGVFVRSIERGGAAAEAGLEPGDIILAVEGQASESAEWFWTLFAAHFVGEQVEFTILREGEARSVRYTIPERSRRDP